MTTQTAESLAQILCSDKYTLGNIEHAAAMLRSQAAEIERLRIPMNRWVVQSIKQEAENALVLGDEIGMLDGLTQILKECDAALGITK